MRKLNLRILLSLLTVMLCMAAFSGVPGMGNDLVVKVHYGLGSRNR